MKYIYTNTMEEKEINPAESLSIITAMIDTAKNKLADDGFLLIFWGWLVFVSAMINYVSILMQSEVGYWVWPVFMPLGGILSVVYGFRQRKKEKVKTYIDTYLGYSWLAFLIAMFITLALLPVHGVKITYFFLMLLYGVATLVSGGLLNFKPLIYGSLFSFAGAIVSVLLKDEQLLLCIAIALLFSYIIPGHLLRSQYKSQSDV